VGGRIADVGRGVIDICIGSICVS